MKLTENFLNTITIRARVAYCLTVAETVFREVKSADKDYTLGREALDTCWEWLEGKEFDGLDIYHLDSREDDELGVIGVAIASIPEKDPNKKNAWYTLSTVLQYLAWHLFILEGYPQESLPQDLESSSENLINDALSYASEISDFQETQFDPLKQHLLAGYPSTEPGEIGPPITREEVMAYLPH
jgi:hypothetical protein